MGAALGEDDPFDRRAADGAWLACALKYVMTILKATLFAAGPCIVLQIASTETAAPPFDSLRQHRAHRVL